MHAIRRASTWQASPRTAWALVFPGAKGGPLLRGNFNKMWPGRDDLQHASQGADKAIPTAIDTHAQAEQVRRGTMRTVRPGVLIADTGFLLAGGTALLAQRLTARPTEDLDFFIAPERGHVPAARDAWRPRPASEAGLRSAPMTARRSAGWSSALLMPGPG